MNTDITSMLRAAEVANIDVALVSRGDNNVERLITPDGTIWDPMMFTDDALEILSTLDICLELGANIEIGFYPGIGGEYAPGIEAWKVVPYSNGQVLAHRGQVVYSHPIVTHDQKLEAIRRAIVLCAENIYKERPQ